MDNNVYPSSDKIWTVLMATANPFSFTAPVSLILVGYISVNSSESATGMFRSGFYWPLTFAIRKVMDLSKPPGNFVYQPLNLIPPSPMYTVGCNWSFPWQLIRNLSQTTRLERKPTIGSEMWEASEDIPMVSKFVGTNLKTFTIGGKISFPLNIWLLSGLGI